jgi:hypothetical protein
MENKVTSQALHLEGTRRLTLTGVSSVDGFTEERIRLSAQTGRIIITGEKLKINCFTESTGAFSCEGRVSSITLSPQRETGVRRLFK